eukprot:Selendium_serpulae@DN6319_c1_g2_i8.p2
MLCRLLRNIDADVGRFQVTTDLADRPTAESGVNLSVQSVQSGWLFCLSVGQALLPPSLFDDRKEVLRVSQSLSQSVSQSVSISQPQVRFTATNVGRWFGRNSSTE